jgi:4-hydroxybenzoate polyprenyltransferase
MKLSKKQTWVLIAILAPLGLALMLFIGGQVVMSLWNWLLPELFGLQRVTFWQALGLLVLSRILFGGFGMGGGGYAPPKKKDKARVRERWGCERPGDDAPEVRPQS